MKIREILQEVGGVLAIPDAAVLETEIKRVAPLDRAVAGELSFLTNIRHSHAVFRTAASAVLVEKEIADLTTPQIVTAHPRAAMARLAARLNVKEREHPRDREHAKVHEQAQIADSSVIYPFVFIDKDAIIGEHSVIYPHCFIGKDVTIGKNTVLHPHVTIHDNCLIGDNVIIHAGTVIGCDGFGFAQTQTEAVKIPHTGQIIIEDNCEIGALNTIARATFAETRIGEGCKFDAQVHIGHNVEIGRYGLIAGQSGIAGSTKIGKNLLMGGQTAISYGLNLPDRVILGARGVIITNKIEGGTPYAGAPAYPASVWRRMQVAIKNLPQLTRTVKKLENQLQKLLNDRK